MNFIKIYSKSIHAKEQFIKNNPQLNQTVHALDKQTTLEIIEQGMHMETFISTNKKSNSAPAEITKRHHALSSFYTEIGYLAMPDRKAQTGAELMKRNIVYTQGLKQYISPYASSTELMKQKQGFKTLKNQGSFVAYDTEVLSGIDQFGAKRFLGMTEFAMVKDTGLDQFEDIINIGKQQLVGIDDALYNELKNEINAGNFTKKSNLNEVVTRRLAIYGHVNTNIISNSDFKLANIPEDYVPTQEEILRGLDRLNAAHHRDIATTRDGLTDSQRLIQEFLQTVHQDKGYAVGYNSARSDNFWINNYLDGLNKETKELILQGIDQKKGTYLDLFGLFKGGAHYSSASHILGTTENDPSHSTFSQETMIKTVLKNQAGASSTAHTGLVDATHLLMLTKSSATDRAINAIPQLETDIVMQPHKQLFYNSKAYFTNSHTSSLAIMVLPNGEIRTGSGYTIKDDKVTPDLFNQSIMQKGGLYTMSERGEFKLSREQKKAMMNINSDFAMDSLYYVDFQPYYADKGDKNLEGQSHSRIFFRTQEEVDSYMGTLTVMGERQDINSSFSVLKSNVPAANQRISEQLNVYNANTKTNESIELEEFIQRQNKHMRLDRASRRVRNHSYDDAKKLSKIYEEVQTSLNNKGHQGAITSLGITSDLKLSATIASGKSINLGLGLETIGDIVGHLDKGYSENALRAYNNTIDTMLAMVPYYEQNQNTINQVLGYVNETYDGHSDYQKRSAYETIMKQLVDTLEINPQDLKLSQADLSYIEIDTNRLQSSRKHERWLSATTDYNTPYMRVNLNGPNSHYELTDNLLNEKFGRSSAKGLAPADRKRQGIAVLDDFSRIVGFSSSNDYSTPDVYASDIVQYLRNKKDDDPLYGIEKFTNMQLFESGAISLDALFAANHTNTKKLIERANASVSKITTLDDVSVNNLSRRMARMFGTLSDPSEYFKQFNIGENETKYLTHVYNRSLDDITNFYQKVISQFSKTPGLTFGLDEKHKRFIVGRGEELIDLTDRLPQLLVYGPMSYLKLGGTQTAITGALLGDKQKFAPESMYLGTSITEALNNIPYSYKSALKRIDQGTLDPLNAIRRVFGLAGQNLRTSSDISRKNMMNQRSNFDVDMSYAMGMLGKLIKSKNLQVDDATRATIERFAGENYDFVDINQTSATYRMIATDYLDEILPMLLGYKMKGKTAEEELLQFVVTSQSAHGPEKKMANMRNVAPSHIPFSDKDPGGRITSYQNNFISYRTQVAEKVAREIYGSSFDEYGLRFNMGFGNRFGKTLGTGKLQDFVELDTQLANQIVVKKATVSHKHFQETLNNYLKKSNYKDNEAVTRLLGHLSLLEDESIMDPRLLDAVFTESDKQKFSVARKDIIEDGNTKKLYERYLNYDVFANQDGHFEIKLGKGKTINKHDYLFSTREAWQGETKARLAYFDGTLKLGFSAGQDQRMLTQDEINQLLRSATTQEEATAIISKLDAQVYMQRNQLEPYRKMNINNVEKTKSRAPMFKVGEYDTSIHDKLLTKATSYTGEAKDEAFAKVAYLTGELRERGDILKGILGLGFSNNEAVALMKDIDTERYAGWNILQDAFGRQGISMFANEDALGHKGISSKITSMILGMEQYHIKQGATHAQAAQLVTNNLKSLKGFETVYSEDADVLLENVRNSTFEVQAFYQMLQEKYSDYFDLEIGDAKEFVGNRLAVEGKTVGTFEYIKLAETTEHNLSTGAMPAGYNEDSYRLNKEIKSIIEEINDMQAYYKETKDPDLLSDIKMLKTKKGKLKERKRLIDAAMAERTKGAAYGERELMTLRHLTYDPAYVQQLLGNAEKLKEDTIKGTSKYEMLGLKELENLEEIKNKPMLQAVLDGIFEEAITYSKQELLTETSAERVVRNLYNDLAVQEGILEVWRHSGVKSLSVELAESSYTIAQMNNALKFNSKRMSREQLIERGFKVIDIQDYEGAFYDDAEALGRGNSIFSKNLVLKMGDQEIAVPRMPSTHYDNDFVRTNLESGIVRARDSYATMHDNEATSEERAKAEKNLVKAKEEIAQTISNLTSKEGPLAGNLKTRSVQSVNLKAATLSQEKGGALDKAFFKGRAVSEWFADDVYVNAAFTGRQAFKEMGLYSTAFKESIGGSMIEDIQFDKVATDEQIDTVLSRYGLDVINTRYPAIQQGSLTAGKLYLDTSIDGDTVKILHADQLRKAGDNDGDTATFYSARYKVGNQVVNSFQLQSLQKYGVVAKGFEDAMVTDAIGINKVMNDLSKTGMLKNYNERIEQNFSNVIAKRYFNQEIVGEAMLNPYVTMSPEERATVANTVSDLKNEYFAANNKKMDYEDLASIDNFINVLEVDDDTKNRYRQAIITDLSTQFRKLTATSKVLKTAIGETNLPLYELRQQADILEMSKHLTHRETELIGELVYPIEQVNISAKKADEVMERTRIEELQKIMQAAYRGTNVEGKDVKATVAMGDYLDTYLKDEYIKKYAGKESRIVAAEYTNKRDILMSEHNLSVDAAEVVLKNEIYEEAKNAVMKEISFLDNPEMNYTSHYLRQFTRGDSTARFYTTEKAEQGVISHQDILSIKNFAYGIGGYEDTGIEPVDLGNLHLTQNHVGKVATTQVTDSLIDSAFEGVNNLKNIEQFYSSVLKKKDTTGLAMGALAMAGAYLLVGAVGGSVTANTTNQAEDMQDGPSTLSDYGGNYSYQTQNTGYVINMSGSTNHANTQSIANNMAQSINQSLSSSMNMNLNITENPLSRFQVDKLLQDVLH